LHVDDLADAALVLAWSAWQRDTPGGPIPNPLQFSQRGPPAWIADPGACGLVARSVGYEGEFLWARRKPMATRKNNSTFQQAGGPRLEGPASPLGRLRRPPGLCPRVATTAIRSPLNFASCQSIEGSSQRSGGNGMDGDRDGLFPVLRRKPIASRTPRLPLAAGGCSNVFSPLHDAPVPAARNRSRNGVGTRSDFVMFAHHVALRRGCCAVAPVLIGQVACCEIPPPLSPADGAVASTGSGSRPQGAVSGQRTRRSRGRRTGCHNSPTRWRSPHRSFTVLPRQPCWRSPLLRQSQVPWVEALWGDDTTW